MRRYEECATRLENRGAHPPTKEYVDNLVAGLLASGVEASWHSAVDYISTPLFPSQVFPVCHPQANMEAFRYLLDRLHGIGRPVLSWHALNLGGGVLPAHPDWRMVFLPGAEPTDFDQHYVCINSPYGELLPHFVAEVVRDVGFDGIWFDGSTFSNHNTQPPFQPGCLCEYCRARFRRDTGRALPERIDFDNPDFRVWVNWRYDVLTEVWRRCVDAVHEVNPQAVVCFNNYRRRTPQSLGWTTGIPMRRLGWDAMMSGELDGFAGQADIQMKLNQAYDLTRGVESWWPLCDHWNLWAPDTEPLSAVQAVLGCISAGGVACTGVGVDATTMTYVLREMEEAARPRMPYLGGETVEYAAILASQSAMDFSGNPDGVWDGIHGANEFCRHAHLQSSVIFDDDLTRGELDRYPVLLLGNAACLNQAQAEQLTAYVEHGGVLVACHAAGTRDALGYPHAEPVLDDLLGITGRQAGVGEPTLEMVQPLSELPTPYVSFKGAFTVATPAADAREFAHIVERTEGSWDGSETGGQPFARQPGCWIRKVGRGAVVYLGVDYFGNYLRNPTMHMLRMLRELLLSLQRPEVTLHGPICVTMNARRQSEGRLAVHLHNAPGSAYSYPNPPGSNYLHAPGEVVPVHDLEIEIRGGRIIGADSGTTGEPLAFTGDNRVIVEKLELHEVVLLDIYPSHE